MEALRPRQAAQRQRPPAVRVDSRHVLASRERVEQVRERRGVEATEVDRGEETGWVQFEVETMQSPGSSAKKSLASATQSRVSTSLIGSVSSW